MILPIHKKPRLFSDVLVWIIAAPLALLSACTSRQLVGQSPGSASLDSSSDDADSFAECAAIGQEARPMFAPTDIIVVIDNSSSLIDEIAEVRTNMNAFSNMILREGVDARIVLISCLPGECVTIGGGGGAGTGICISPPLGAPDGCQPLPDLDTDSDSDYLVTDDNNPPLYTHISTRVPSLRSLEWIINHYPAYFDVLRPEAQKHIIAITDGSDQMTADEFHSEILSLSPPLLNDYIFHGIFSYYSKEVACEMDPPHACCEYAAPAPADVPYLDTYRELVERTGGTSGDLCLQDFGSVFSATATQVVDQAALPCDWQIPSPPDGMTLDPGLVNVVYWDGQSTTSIIGMVETVEQCADVDTGWYYDNPDNPSRISFCPVTCAGIQGAEGARINIEFGCETEGAGELQ